MGNRESKKVSSPVDFPASQLQATCVAINSYCVLLIGESGSGKSDLALRLINRGASLVSDDRVNLMKNRNTIIASSPENIAGLLEVRGIGIFKMKTQNNISLSLVIKLDGKDSIERLPDPEFYECMGIKIPQIHICPFEASAPVKIEMAVAALSDGSLTVGALKSDTP